MNMKWLVLIYFGLVYTVFPAVAETLEEAQVDFYQEAQNENFDCDELKFLQPFIDNFQLQYDQIASKSAGRQDLLDDENVKHLNELILEVLDNFPNNDEFFDESFTFDTRLPSLNALKGVTEGLMSSAEAIDLENILREDIGDAQKTIQDLVDQSIKIRANLITINKIKMFKFIYKMLGYIFTNGVRASRTAYCIYSDIPQINSTLIYGQKEIGACYVSIASSIVNLRRDVQKSIDTIRENVVELVGIYKKIANRQSLLGKIFSLLTNVPKIRKDITESRSIALGTIEGVKTQSPIVIATTRTCAATSVPSFVKRLNETITHLVTCINFVDDSTEGPEPEPESSEESFEKLDVNLLHEVF